MKGSRYSVQLGRLLMMALVAASSLATSPASAQVEGGFVNPGHGGGWGPDGRPGRPDFPGRRPDRAVVTINENYRGFSSIDVDSQFARFSQGRAIRSLTVRMASREGRSQATLLVDGNPSGHPQVVASTLTEYSFDVQETRGRPSRYNPDLELRLNGPVFVQSLEAEFDDGGFQEPNLPDRDVLTKYMNQYFPGDQMLSLNQLVNLDRYQGYRVDRVTVRMRTAAGNGRARLYVNGQPSSEPVVVAAYTQDYHFRPEARIGHRRQDELTLHLRGRFTIENVSVEVSRVR